MMDKKGSVLGIPVSWVVMIIATLLIMAIIGTVWIVKTRAKIDDISGEYGGIGSSSSGNLKTCGMVYGSKDDLIKDAGTESSAGKTYMELIDDLKISEDDKENVAAIIAIESGFDEDAEYKTAAGLLQAVPETAASILVCPPYGEKCVKLCGDDKCSNQKEDYRKNPIYAVSGAYEIFKLKRDSIVGCSSVKGDDLDRMAAAAYIAGEGVICDAIKKTGKRKPSWMDVERKLTPDLISYKNSPFEQKEIIGETICHDRRFMNELNRFEGEFS